ncbi:MAG: T9SS type A sorting domain-containing protein [Bacteroidetes bacterium]|nr:T9SS type A sorting domain-containing protein [Bacteroidota bacterium]
MFFVKLQSNSNCLSVGITEPENSDYSIYPNPTNGIIHLSNLICNENIEIQILNSLGQIQLHQTFTNENAIELHLENYPKGIYFLKYRCGGLCRTEKIILQ